MPFGMPSKAGGNQLSLLLRVLEELADEGASGLLTEEARRQYVSQRGRLYAFRERVEGSFKQERSGLLETPNAAGNRKRSEEKP